MNSLKAKIKLSNAARSLKAGQITQEEFDKIRAEVEGTDGGTAAVQPLTPKKGKKEKAEPVKAEPKGE